ncbi:MAG: hypothetical protein EB141_17050 [Verrucomicrobia bacterium]|nr:hypothetical protein [Verrucomicrobiota bacterium]NBU11650.1 hypothetical protein [Pseudomonadota bacterium]NDA68561.1 hypothetical protein [Verrucomicrobiota bacterium]NDB77319.1 hypothetical protein [Verrucomicrobiota bacterium]NDD40280.1 hypothetical protein [Verrucomicrobiota bacterium]
MFAAIALQFLGVGQNRPEPLFEDLLGIGFLFAESNGAVAAGLGGDGKSANAGKQVKVGSHEFT